MIMSKNGMPATKFIVEKRNAFPRLCDPDKLCQLECAMFISVFTYISILAGGLNFFRCMSCMQ